VHFITPCLREPTPCDLDIVGIGILVEILRRLGLASVAIRAEERTAKAAGQDGSSATSESDSTARG
jgi:hypothetical protein